MFLWVGLFLATLGYVQVVKLYNASGENPEQRPKPKRFGSMQEASAQGTHARTEPIRRFCALAQIPFQKELQGHWEAARSPVRGGSSHFLRGLTIVGHSSSSFLNLHRKTSKSWFKIPKPHSPTPARWLIRAWSCEAALRRMAV